MCDSQKNASQICNFGINGLKSGNFLCSVISVDKSRVQSSCRQSCVYDRCITALQNV